MRFFTALSETVYCSQPARFVDLSRPDMVCRLNKSLWSEAGSSGLVLSIRHVLTNIGFTEAKSDTSLFIYRRGDETSYLLLYVDDIVLTASSQRLLQSVITSLQQDLL